MRRRIYFPTPRGSDKIYNNINTARYTHKTPLVIRPKHFWLGLFEILSSDVLPAVTGTLKTSLFSDSNRSNCCMRGHRKRQGPIEQARSSVNTFT